MCVQRVTGSGPPAPELRGLRLPTRAAPLAEGVVGDDEAPGAQELCHVAGTQTEAAVPPDPRTDDLGREAVVLVAVGRSWAHAASIARQPGVGPAARQNDNARTARAGHGADHPVGPWWWASPLPPVDFPAIVVNEASLDTVERRRGSMC
jgi:hypothetical protein